MKQKNIEFHGVRGANGPQYALLGLAIYYPHPTDSIHSPG